MKRTTIARALLLAIVAWVAAGTKQALASKTPVAQPQDTGSANVLIGLSASPQIVGPGQIFLLAGVVGNNGPDTPQNTTAVVSLPQGVKVQACNVPAGITCTVIGQTVTQIYSSLQPYNPIGFTLLLKVSENILQPKCPPNTATCPVPSSLLITGLVTSELPNPFTNNTSFVTVTLIPAGASPAQMTFSTAKLSFGDTLITNASSPLSVTVTNAGSSDVNLVGPVVEGNFSTGVASCGREPTIPPGASCTIPVSFNPRELGPQTGKLIFTEVAPGVLETVGQQVVDLKGTGVAMLGGKVSVVYPLTLVGQPASLSTGASLYNLGPVPMALGSYQLSGDPDFVLADNDCPQMLPPYSECRIGVTFLPTKPGMRNGKLTVNFDGPESPLVALLSGPATALSISTRNETSINHLSTGMGDTYLGVGSPPILVTLQNASSESVPIEAIDLTGEFHQQNDCPAKLKGGASCTLSVYFKPRADGLYAGTLSITDQDLGSPQTVDFTGAGVGIKRKKIFLHYDYMVATDHTHDPEVVAPGAIQVVVDAFAAHGVELVIDPQHTAIPEIPTIGFEDSTCPGFTGFDTLRATYFTPTRVSEHYAIFAHSHVNANQGGMVCQPTTATGLAELPGLNFVVSLGQLQEQGRSSEELVSFVAGTFMHELGHNLGLHHGGGFGQFGHLGGGYGISDNDLPYKPHYTSIMNYAYQLVGIVQGDSSGSIQFHYCTADPDCPTGSRCLGDPAVSPQSSTSKICRRVDYSVETLPTGGPAPGVLDENDLDESAGLGSGNADIVSFTDGMCNFALGPSDGPVDWDGDGVASNMHARADLVSDYWTLGGYGCPSGIYITLRGADDWANLQPPAQAAAETQEAAGAHAAGTQEPQDADESPASAPGKLPSPLSGPELSIDEAKAKHVLRAPARVSIRVSPSCALPEKPIAPGSPGQVSVAILGSAQLDVSEIENSSLRMQGAPTVGTQLLDINGDGFPDLVATFDMAAIRLHPSAKKARVTGWLKNSRLIFGEDRIRVVGDMAGENAACR